MDSPRGRIFLMKEVLEGKLSPEAAQPHIDRCLGCLACQTHCPSGVQYGELLSPYRAWRKSQGDPGGDRLRRALASLTLPYPSRFRWAMRLGRLGRKLNWMVPKRLRPMVELVPDVIPPARPIPEVSPATTARRGRVALLGGCAQQVLAPEINHAAVLVLNRNGFEVWNPPDQVCCGALSWHTGDDKRAMAFAQQNLNAFGEEVDWIVTTAAGCGSALHEYPLMLAGTEAADRAKHFAKRAIDICEFLMKQGIEKPAGFKKPLKVAYHDACHLSHGQKVRSAPRALLRMLDGVELCELSETELCCGSAGTYNLDQPEIAAQLGRAKAEQVIATGADCLVLGNIGCMVQIRQHLRALGSNMPVMHTIELLAKALVFKL